MSSAAGRGPVGVGHHQPVVVDRITRKAAQCRIDRDRRGARRERRGTCRRRTRCAPVLDRPGRDPRIRGICVAINTVWAVSFVAVGAATSGGANSYAPASQPAPCGRGRHAGPSVVPHGAGTRSIAMLPALSAIVSVGPPLSASGPSSGLPTRPGHGVVAGSATLPPPSLNVPKHTPMIEALIVTSGESGDD